MKSRLNIENKLKRGQLYYADMGKGIGSEQSGIRLICIVQNEMGNNYSATTIVCPLTSKIKTYLPTHVSIDYTPKPSIILAEQIRTISIKRIFIENLIGTLREEDIKKLEDAIKISLELE